MPYFFIDRPIFAWAVALAVSIVGLLALPSLPVTQFPRLAPPRVMISLVYPGATAETTDANIASIIEESLAGASGLLYYQTSSDGNGSVQIGATFAPGTNPDLAVVDVQNRLKEIESRLPQEVVQQGISVSKSSGSFLMIVALTSDDGTRDSGELGDYMNRYVLGEIKRAPGVGEATLWDSDLAMRIWVDPAKLREYGLSAEDVLLAIRAQNVAVAPGSLGEAPFVPTQQLTASLVLTGQLSSPEEFGDIALRSSVSGATVHLRDVARIGIDKDDYSFYSRVNGRQAATIGIQLAPDGNAIETASAIHERLNQISHSLPHGVSLHVPYDASVYVQTGIREVILTLAEASLLVVLVMRLFLPDWRFAIIPAVVIPITMLGTCAILEAIGYSINTFTMFGMILSIGILVDDAIVVVENVERVMKEQQLPPREATLLAMKQIVGALIGVAVVLTSTFIPLAFVHGGVGEVYRQFSVAMISTMGVSAFLALSLTPALCASLLKSETPYTRRSTRTRLDRWFDIFRLAVERMSKLYRRLVRHVLIHSRAGLVAYVLLVAGCACLFVWLPKGFLPSEDQGTMQVIAQLPPGATQNRTSKVLEEVEQALRTEPSVADVTTTIGYSNYGNSQNTGQAFVQLKPWDQRATSITELKERLNAKFASINDGQVSISLPSAVPGLGNSDGFVLRLEDRGGLGMQALLRARQVLFDTASLDPRLANLHSESLTDAPQIVLNIDRAKAFAMGLTFDSIQTALTMSFGTSYVADYPSGGRMSRVLVAGLAKQRMSEQDLMDLTVQNAAGNMVPLSSFCTYRWASGPISLMRYNGYPALDVTGRPAGGYSLGQAIIELQKLADSLPEGIGYEWTGQAREANQASAQIPLLITLSLLSVFLSLAALYESWAIPLSVLMIMPLGALGAVVAMMARGLTHDIYFNVGLVTVFALTSKNAILIIEFARHLQKQGASIIAAVTQAATMRFRPIVMTSMAFLLGVLPLLTASGAGAASRRSIGTGVFGGVIAATLLSLVFAPLAYLLVSNPVRAFKASRGLRKPMPATEPA